MNKILTLLFIILLSGCQSTLQKLDSSHLSSSNKNKAELRPSIHDTHKLYVKVSPADAQIYITNIKPKFAQGIELKNGEYKIKIKKKGFKTTLRTVTFSALDKDKTLTVNIKKDKLTFESSKSIRTMTRLRNPSTVQRHNQRNDNLFKKKSISLALASLIEWNKGQTTFPYRYMYGDHKMDIEKRLFEPAYKRIKKDLSYKKNLSIVNKYETSALKKIQSLRPKAAKYLNSLYVIKLRYGFNEEELVAAFDDEDEVFSLEIDWQSTFFADDSYIKRNRIDYVNVEKFKKELRATSSQTSSYVHQWHYNGKMKEQDITLKNISYDNILTLWKNMPRSRYKRGEKILEVDVLVEISNVKLNGPTNILFELKPSQISIKGLNLKQNI